MDNSPENSAASDRIENLEAPANEAASAGVSPDQSDAVKGGVLIGLSQPSLRPPLIERSSPLNPALQTPPQVYSSIDGL